VLRIFDIPRSATHPELTAGNRYPVFPEVCHVSRRFKSLARVYWTYYRIAHARPAVASRLGVLSPLEVMRPLPMLARLEQGAARSRPIELRLR
jgi:hypothetical protein